MKNFTGKWIYQQIKNEKKLENTIGQPIQKEFSSNSIGQNSMNTVFKLYVNRVE